MSKEQITALIKEGLDRAIAEGKLPAVDAGRIELDRPKRKEHGDWATNLALAVAGKVEMNPRQVAEAIKDSLPEAPDVISGVEVAGPGFINFHLAPHFVRAVLLEIEEGRGLRRLQSGSRPQGAGRVREREPGRAAPRGARPLGGAGRRAGERHEPCRLRRRA